MKRKFKIFCAVVLALIVVGGVCLTYLRYQTNSQKGYDQLFAIVIPYIEDHTDFNVTYFSLDAVNASVIYAYKYEYNENVSMGWVEMFCIMTSNFAADSLHWCDTAFIPEFGQIFWLCWFSGCNGELIVIYR